MAGNFLSADISMPDLDKHKTTDQKLRAIESYLFQLLESLRYTLRNLSMDNFNQDDLAKWVDTLEAGKVITQTLISNTVVTQALYASYGDVADLTVARLSTSRRIPKYLAGDTTDDNYILVEKQRYTMMRAWTDGSSEQARNPLGAPLYWEADVEGALAAGTATLASDGYPRIEGERVNITTKATQWPVHVYVYSEGERWKLTFSGEEDSYGPKMIWGMGDGSDTGRGRGYMEKLGLSYDIYNLGTDGVKRGVFMGNEYVDIVGRRKPDMVKVTQEGMTVNLQGNVSLGFSFGYNEAGELATITDGDGHVMTLEMEAETGEEA